MTRARISTTVDRALLDGARRLHAGTTDAELVDEALTALLDRYRSAEIDAAYAATIERRRLRAVAADSRRRDELLPDALRQRISTEA